MPATGCDHDAAPVALSFGGSHTVIDGSWMFFTHQSLACSGSFLRASDPGAPFGQSDTRCGSPMDAADAPWACARGAAPGAARAASSSSTPHIAAAPAARRKWTDNPAPIRRIMPHPVSKESPLDVIRLPPGRARFDVAAPARRRRGDRRDPGDCRLWSDRAAAAGGAGVRTGVPPLPPVANKLPRSTPEAQGVSSPALLAFVEAADSDIDAMHSFMLVRHGQVVAEGWWAPYDADDAARAVSR